jgi:hypothetical protein
MDEKLVTAMCCLPPFSFFLFFQFYCFLECRYPSPKFVNGQGEKKEILGHCFQHCNV